ncbi:MAG: hypothetical protein ACE5G9_12480 [Nitrospinales bacterium]
MAFVYRAPHLLSHGEWDAYGIADRDFGINYYPPLAMIFFGGIQALFGFLVPPFEAFTHLLLNGNMKLLFTSNHMFLSLFLMKLPYLVVEWLLIRTCWKMFPSEEEKKKVAVFWVVNPVVIYGTYMMGQFDVIPAYCIVLACYYAMRPGKEHYACLSLSVGGLFKLVPFIFIPMVLFIAARSAKDFFRLSLYAIVPALVIYTGFYMVTGDAVIRQFVDLSSSFRITGGHSTLLLRFCQFGAYALVCHHVLFVSRGKLNYSLLVQYCLIVQMAIFWGLTVHSTHYFIWGIPVFILYVLENPAWQKPFYFFLAAIFLCGLKSRSTAMGIFAPVNPELFMSFPSLMDVTGYLFGVEAYFGTMLFIVKSCMGLFVIYLFRNLYWAPRAQKA